MEIEKLKLEKTNKSIGYEQATIHTKILLLDMLRSWEISSKEHSEMVRWIDKAHRDFIVSLHKKPLDEDDVLYEEK